MTLQRESGTRQCLGKVRLTQHLGGKALSPSSGRGFMSQDHVDQPSVVHYVVNEVFDSILFP